MEKEVAEAQKKAKKEEKKSDSNKEDAPAEISINDFAKINLKVGKVLECKRVEGADKLLVSQIKIGDEVRQIVSGIAKYYSPEDMVGKKVVVVTNLKPVKLRGVLSQGMILAAADENGNLSLVAPDKDLSDGSKVQ
ncbi:MAG: methionine--tRNA ligase subunit beta [Oscillospiraceae bacterium]|nr:methionine--tRNA ligase subunit beta [Oscillospiraceae bacterium]